MTRRLAPIFDTIERDLLVHAASSHYNVCNHLFRRGVRRWGWHGAPVPQARKGCIGSGYCMQGCAYSTSSMLVTYVPRAVAASAPGRADYLRHDGRNGR